MRKFFPILVFSGLAASALPSSSQAGAPAASQTPGQIVNAAPAADWLRIAATDLVIMDLKPGPTRKPRRELIQLIPAQFSQGRIGNTRQLVTARCYVGIDKMVLDSRVERGCKDV